MPGGKELLPVSVAEGKTVPAMFHSRVQLSGDGVALRYKKLGIWHDVSWKEYGRRVREVCMALLALGLKPGECVSVIGENSPEWVYIDLGSEKWNWQSPDPDRTNIRDLTLQYEIIHIGELLFY